MPSHSPKTTPSDALPIVGDESACLDVLLLVGIPGSGKSTLARCLAQSGWSVCCQDELGDRVTCERFAWEELERGHRVVIDRCNVTKLQRQLWLKLCCAVKGPQAQVAAVVFRTPLEECARRAMGRQDHASLIGDQAQPVIARFASEFEEPTHAEGFAMVISSQECLDDVLGGMQPVVPLPEDSSLLLPGFDTCINSGSSSVKSGDELAQVLGKMKCVYITEHCMNECSVKEGRESANIATGHILPEASAMFREGLYVATVKVHGRCCMWKGGKCFRRLDIDLNDGNQSKMSRKLEAQVDAFMVQVGEQLGVDLTHCWQAGAQRSWSWRGCLQHNWGWIATCIRGGWQPTSAPDRHGHWIGYTPVKHLDGRGRVLPVDHDADVRHGFDEMRGVAFCLTWSEDNNDNQLMLQEVPMSGMVDGTYELVGPNDCHGGPYRNSLPLTSEDLTYAVRFPEWDNDRNERHYFIRHGSVQWSNDPPPNPLDKDAFRQWMQLSGVEGVVWHGRGRFEGQMYKCHFGHLGLGKPSYRFTRHSHIFPPVAAVAGNGVQTTAACHAPVMSGVCRSPGLDDDVQQVVLLRHGQSIAQKATQKQRSQDRQLLDAPLSSEGHRQVASLKVAERPDLVVVSPLTRALQTAQAILAQVPGCPCIAHPCLQEFSDRSSSNSGWESIGRRLCDLQSDDCIDLTCVDVSLLGGAKHQWWVDSSEHAASRAQKFSAWLCARPERYILIVGHNNIFRELLKGGSGSKSAMHEIANCEPVGCKVQGNGLVLVRTSVVQSVSTLDNCTSSSAGVVILRICRAADQKDVKIINVSKAAGVTQVLQAAQNKWRAKKFRPRLVMLSSGEEVTDESLTTLKDNALVVCH